MADTPRVLLVENDQFLGAESRSALEAAGFVVDLAETGREALVLARAARPTVAVVEIWLPDLDGIAIAGALRAAHGDHLPVVVLSASLRDMARAERQGTFTCLPKAFDVTTLVAAVRQAVPTSVG